MQSFSDGPLGSPFYEFTTREGGVISLRQFCVLDLGIQYKNEKKKKKIDFLNFIFKKGFGMVYPRNDIIIRDVWVPQLPGPPVTVRGHCRALHGNCTNCCATDYITPAI